MRHFVLEGVPGAECTATRTIGSYKSQAGREIILGSYLFWFGISPSTHNSSCFATISLRPHSRSVATESAARHVWNGSSVGLGGFLQERATTTLKRSITLLQLRVLRLPRNGPGSDRGFQPRSPGRGSGGGRGSIRNRLSSSPTVLPTRSSRPQLIPDILRTTVMCGRRKPRELLSQWFKTPVRFLPGVFSNSHRCSCPISVRTSSLLARASAS